MFFHHGLALLFPVKWHEPFGLALIESLYFGNPVFGTPFGFERFDRRRCHEYACDRFSSTVMAKNYVDLS